MRNMFGNILNSNQAQIDQLSTLKNPELARVLQNIYGRLLKSSPTFSFEHKFHLIIVSVIETRNPTNKLDKSVLDLAYKIYFKVLELANEKDERYYPNIDNQSLTEKSLILQAILESDYSKHVEVSLLKETCLKLFNEAVMKYSKVLLTSIKILNILHKKCCPGDFYLPLEHLYYCLQSNATGVREETILLITFYTKNLNACSKCLNILHFWPWTNRIKLYFISAILSNYKFSNFAQYIDEFSSEIFMEGVRISLSFKSLFSAGQTLVRALDKQQCVELYNLICKIIRAGKSEEIANLNTQWMRHITQKDEIFMELKLNCPWDEIQQDTCLFDDDYKFPLICNMFSHQITKHKDFSEIFSSLRRNCFRHSLDAQLHIYTFTSDSMHILPDHLEECLEFIRIFIQTHLYVPNSEFRQTVLSKLPLIFDSLSKKRVKCVNDEIVTTFLKEIILITQNGMLEKEYQPLIFSLKILSILIKCFFASAGKRMTKNSNVTMNQLLGQILIKRKVFDAEVVENELFKILNCPETRYDDVHELVVDILKQLKLSKSFREAYNMCKTSNKNSVIDQCSLSSYYARICLNSSCVHSEQKKFLVEFFDYYKKNIKEILNKIKEDPLETCKSGNHLFGCMNSLNELLKFDMTEISTENITEIIDLIEVTSVLLLKFFNEASDNSESDAPSFQIMDESLEIIVCRSCIDVEDSSNEKKFLLLSFWMTLKACCELAATIGSNLSTNTNDNDCLRVLLIHRCIKAHCNVLSKCRHKGAIEAAGLSLGKLVKVITSQNSKSSPVYQLLYSSFEVLFGSVNEISTTRRGAGFSIMFHHLLKNEMNKDRPLFDFAMNILLKDETANCDDLTKDEQHENFSALILHYLCVIVRDTELRESVSNYFDDIMMTAIRKIEDKDWRVRNAALQLFGALIPKIIGQKQVLSKDIWESTEVTYFEVFIKLPRTCSYIMQYCNCSNQKGGISTSSLILFLEFFSNFEFMRKAKCTHFALIEEFRSLFWSFLSHECEKVRKLSAKCLARIHDLFFELPNILWYAMKTLFKINNENFRHGIVLFTLECIYKIKYNLRYITNISDTELNNIFKSCFYENYCYRDLSFYVKSQLIKFFLLAKLDFESKEVLEILFSRKNVDKRDVIKIVEETRNNTTFHPGYDVWKEQILKVYKIET